jgi:hypothetical protein
VPIPDAARYNAPGHPMPPHPMIAILEFLSLSCPEYPIYFKSICLEYL